MAEQPQYVVEQALKDCLEDMKKLRKQMSRNLPAQAVPPLAEALVKLRAESLWLRDELAEAERPTTTAPDEPADPAAEAPPVDDPGDPGEPGPEETPPDARVLEYGAEAEGGAE